MLSCRKRLILEPQADCPWASKMVLNPAIIRDPGQSNVIHMLFRASGPCESKQLPGKPLPYPISLGYAVSSDYGETWHADFTRPALAPALKYERNEIFKADGTFNYANGCIEDPRMFYFESQLYMSVACRVFPPGPYWENDNPRQCMPDWALEADESIERAVRENYTVSLLYKVNLPALARRDYDSAFDFITPLHDPESGDNRDAFLFPERININGKRKVACLHRPMNPEFYDEGKGLRRPSIFIATADSMEDLATVYAEQEVLAAPAFEWESNRIGASWPPIKISLNRWLLAYHGKQDDIGYTQSFMILQEQENSAPRIEIRCPERLMYASEYWELGTDFPTPCLFTCSGIIINGHKLMMGYGAADQKIGIAEVELFTLIDKIISN